MSFWDAWIYVCIVGWATWAIHAVPIRGSAVGALFHGMLAAALSPRWEWWLGVTAIPVLVCTWSGSFAWVLGTPQWQLLPSLAAGLPLAVAAARRWHAHRRRDRSVRAF